MIARRTLVFHAISAVSLALCMWAFRGQIGLASLPADRLHGADLYPGTFGDVTVASREEARRLAESLPPEAVIEFRSAKGGVEELTLVAAYRPAQLATTAISGLLFWAVSAFVFAPRIGQQAAGSFYGCTLLYGVAIMIGGVYFPRATSTTALNLIQLAALAALPVLFLGLCLEFPRPVMTRHRGALLSALWLAAFAVTVWQAFAFTRYFESPGPQSASTLTLPHTSADVLLVAEVAAAMAILAIGTRRLELDRERRQSKWLLVGILLGVTPYVFLRTLPQLFGLEPPFSSEVDRIFELAIPTSFVLAVVRYRFLDIDIIIRRGLIYGILAAGVVLVCLIIAVVLGQRIESAQATRGWILFVLIGLGAGVLFGPLQTKIGSWVDRTFFRLSHDHEARLGTLRERLETAPDERRLARIVSGFLVDAFEPRQHAVVWREGSDDPVGELGPAARHALRALHDLEPSSPGLIAAPNSTSLPELEPSLFPASLRSAGIVLVASIQTSGSGVGFVLLGAKSTDRRYVEPDIELIQRAVRKAGDALERIRLVRAVADQEAARQRSEEMNRLKNEFLSRVAHDLRTPLTAIRWSVDNLLDGAVGEMPPQQVDYLRGILISAGYLGRLVANLLEISRLEQQPAPLDLMPVHLQTILRDAIDALRPLADEKGVELRLSAPRECDPVLGNAERIQEVAVNLLDNAIKFSPPGSSVDVTIEGRNEGRCTFAVRDRGPGFAIVRTEDVFARFSQGKASPYSSRKGFGLGLYIVREYMTLMQGEVEMENHPQGGAVLRCRFREAPTRQEART